MKQGNLQIFKNECIPIQHWLGVGSMTNILNKLQTMSFQNSIIWNQKDHSTLLLGNTFRSYELVLLKIKFYGICYGFVFRYPHFRLRLQGEEKHVHYISRCWKIFSRIYYGFMFLHVIFRVIVNKILHDLKLKKFMNFEGVCDLLRILFLLLHNYWIFKIIA
jgi:hypothetical protein